MRRFAYGGYSVEVDEEGGRFAWTVRPGHALVVVLRNLVLFAMCAPWGSALMAGLFIGRWSPPLDRATGLLWLASRLFILLLACLGLLIGLFGVGALLETAGFLVRGTRPYALDRWDGRFRLGRRGLCELDRISAVCFRVEDDTEGNRQLSIGFRLKDGAERSFPHFFPDARGPDKAVEFVAGLAGFLGVPVVKAEPGGSRERPGWSELEVAPLTSACEV